MSRTRSEVLAAQASVIGCCSRFADMMSCSCLDSALPDSTGRALAKSRRKTPAPVKGFRGEPWSTDGRFLYDRNGYPFATMNRGAEEFARTIVACVNLLTNVPLRPTDQPGLTTFQKHALDILASEARKLGDDPL